MTDVLRALEHSEREAGEEVASRQQTGGRSKRETGVLLQEIGHLVQLRYLFGRENPVVLQQLESVPVFHAEMFGHQVQHGVEHRGPRAQFVGRVLDVWDRVTAVNARRLTKRLITINKN